MSHNSSPTRSSHSSLRSRSRSPTPASPHGSPLLSAPLSGYVAERASSNNYLSPASIYHHPSTSSPSLHPTTNSITGYHHRIPPLDVQPTYATQRSTSPHQLPHSTYPAYSFPQPPPHLTQPPFSQPPYYPPPATNIPYSNPIHLHTPQPFITIHEPEDLTYQNYPVHQQALHIPQGQASTGQGQIYYGNGMFKKSQNFSVASSTFIDNSITSDNFMNEFLHHTIIGAEFDSSARHPPPRCLPGTRLAIIERCKLFIEHCNGEEKVRWVVGGAGVGKSAVMQIVAEEMPADASVFLSVNGRQDGAKTFMTIAYQLAAKYGPYRQYIRQEISRDPSLLQKSLPVQFEKFIVDPFIRHPLFNPSRRFLIIIDGLDECDNPLTERELLRLISYFCITYPTSSVVWIVASRPEPHITSFFDDARVAPAYAKEEIRIDSNEACEDVQRYLRNELKEIKLAYPVLKRKREWPSELEFTRIAAAAGGLFAYASAVVRCIGDPHYRDPAAQLRRVLEDIRASPTDGVSGRDYPMVQLDALYQRILSNIPADVMINTRKLLLIYSNYGWNGENFRWQCNRLGLTEDAAYGATCHLHAVVKVPAPDEADDQRLEYLHKSFEDFLIDFKRSRFSRSIEDEVEQLQVQSSVRIVKQVPDKLGDMACGEGIRCYPYGYLKGSPGLCNKISISWPGDGRHQTTDDSLRRHLYCKSMDHLCSKFRANWTISCFHVFTTRFIEHGPQFPIYELRESAFEEFRSQLTELGKLKQVPLRALDYAAICGLINFRFMSPIGMDAKHSDPWNPSCMHRKYGEEKVDQRRGWSTSVGRFLNGPGDDVPHADIPRFRIKAGKDFHWGFTLKLGCYECPYCLRRFASHFINSPDQLATVFSDATEMCYVELSIVDPDDGLSEWRYRFFHSGPPSGY